MVKITTKGSKQTIDKKPIVKTAPEVKFVGEYTPEYATKGSACFDLKCIQKERIFPGELVKVDLGIKVEIPKGYYMEIVARSSLVKSGLILANSVGVIDTDYRGPVFAALRNVGKTKIILPPGQRIVQGMLKPIEQVTFKQVKKLSETVRGEGGYGSTGNE